MKFDTLVDDGRPDSCGTSTSSRTSPASTARRRRSCRSRSSATTARACTATSRSGRTSKPLFAGDGYAGLSRDGALLHRRHPQARAGALRLHQPDDQQLPPAGPGLRGAGEPGVLGAQPLGVDPHPDVLRRRRRPSASSSAAPTRRCNPYLAFAAMLMAGLDGIQNKIDPGEPLDKDIYALSPEELKDVPKAPGSLDEALDGARAGPRVPAQGRRLHAGRDRDLDRLQARERGGRDPPAAAPVRVRPLLRQLALRTGRPGSNLRQTVGRSASGAALLLAAAPEGGPFGL